MFSSGCQDSPGAAEVAGLTGAVEECGERGWGLDFSRDPEVCRPLRGKLEAKPNVLRRQLLGEVAEGLPDQPGLLLSFPHSLRPFRGEASPHFPQ